MRPQPEGCGEPCGQRKVVDGGCPLQCGHSPKAVENNAAGGKSKREMTASMRPQPEGCGEHRARLFICLGCEGFNAATARRLWRTADSLRKIKREILLQCGHSPKAVENPRLRSLRGGRGSLQCGHSPKAVENAQLSEFELHASLQCGHSPKAVENQPVDPAPCFATCFGFNAATARRLWRTETRMNDWQAY